MLFIRSAGCADAAKRELPCDARVSFVNRLDCATFRVKPLKPAGSELMSNVASFNCLVSVTREYDFLLPMQMKKTHLCNFSFIRR